MDLLQARRKLLGRPFRSTDDGEAGYDNWAPTPPATVGSGTPVTPVETPVAPPAETPVYNWYDAGLTGAGWSAGPEGVAKPVADKVDAKPGEAATVEKQAPADEKSLVQRVDLLGRPVPQMSMDPNQTENAKLVRLGVTGPKDDNFRYQGVMTQQQKEAFSGWSKDTQEGYLKATNKPVSEAYTYNPVNPGWREKLTDMTTPARGSLFDKLGAKGAGTTSEQFFDNETQAERELRMKTISDGLERAAKFVIGAMPGGGAAMTVAKAINAVQNEGMSPFDAFKAAAFDIGGSKVAGAINKDVFGALGPEATKLASYYNPFASVVNLGAPGTLPAANPGAMAVGAARDALSIPKLGDPSGMTTPSGESIMSTAGWAAPSGGSHSSGVSAPAADSALLQQADPVSTAAGLTGVNTNMRVNLNDQINLFRQKAGTK